MKLKEDNLFHWYKFIIIIAVCILKQIKFHCNRIKYDYEKEIQIIIIKNKENLKYVINYEYFIYYIYIILSLLLYK